MEPEVKVGSHWECIFDGKHVVQLTSVAGYIYWKNLTLDNVSGGRITKERFLERFKPRPDLDAQESTINQTNQKTKEAPKDATNSQYIGIITNSDDEYVGYVYSSNEDELKEIIAKPSNEGNTIHTFKFNDSFKQATRPVVKVPRSTTPVEDPDV
jgi:hypothetical protein